MRKFAIILIIVGILVGVSPLVGQLYNKYQEYKLMTEWLDSAEATATGESTGANPEDAYSQLGEVFASESRVEATEAPATPQQTQAEATPKPAKEAPKQTVLGIIQIKKIKVKVPIVEGVKASNLKVGIGHVPGTAALGQPGNSALAGHRSYTFGKYFNRLDELVEGDDITITTKKEDLTYRVYKKYVVTPDDVSVLKGSKDDNIITLITCTPIYIASHRLIVQARLLDKVLKEP